MIDPDIDAHYRLGLERERLGGRVEYVRTRELLARFLPQPPAVVLDVGGGPGAYAVPLTREGYTVHLLDPVALHVEQARAAGVATATVGDARRLPFADATADAALLLGPLYHLTERADRVAALREARRAVRPGGPVLAAAVSRFASTHDGLRQAFLADPDFEAIVDGDLRDGVHRNPDPVGRPEWFTTAYFHRPEELREEFEAAGLAVEALLAVEGPASFRPELDEWLADPERREVLLRAIRRVEGEPSLLGASSHLLVAGRSTAPSSTA